MKTKGYLLSYNDSRMKVRLKKYIVYYPYDDKWITYYLDR